MSYIDYHYTYFYYFLHPSSTHTTFTPSFLPSFISPTIHLTSHPFYPSFLSFFLSFFYHPHTHTRCFLHLTFYVFQECLIELLQEMFGEDSVPKIFKGEKIYVSVDNVKANVDLVSLVSPYVYVCLANLHS